jgi:hypothetical protein
METKFTPGPWEAVERGDGWNVMIGLGWIASVATKEDTQICAAAPEMYAALKAVFDDSGKVRIYTLAERNEWIAQARAALAKADGK